MTLLYSVSFRLAATLAMFLLGSTLHAATLTRTSAYTYHPDTGLLLTETMEPDNPALILVTTYTHDNYGNRATVTISGPGIESRTTTTTYGAYGTFPKTSINAMGPMGQTENYAFNPRFGTLDRITDQNSLSSYFTVDTFGRPETAKGPDTVLTTYTRDLCSPPGTNGCPGLAAYYVTATKPGVPTRTAYFDKFNREIRTQTVGFDGRWVIKDTEYDRLGRVYRVSRPYYAGDPVYFTTYTYDLLNRVTSETDPHNKTSYFDYYRLTTTTTNVLGQRRTTVVNSQGQLTSVTDANYQKLRYNYDPFGNLTQTLDPANNAVLLSYDVRGRKVAMVDPDMGTWKYTYTALGELKTQTDAKEQVTTWTYDKLSRMTSRTEPDLTTTWSYDTGTKGIGKLASTSTDNGQTRNFIYDSMGRLSITRTVIGNTTLSITSTYDTYGRPDSQTDPAGVSVQNIYNAHGYLSQVRNAQTMQVYWTGSALSADGQLTSGQFGNGVVESRVIDPLGRTTEVNATHSLGAVTALGYVYDALNNLKTRTDTLQSLTENFGYDALNRLTSVTSNNPSQDPKTVQYNNLGNITYKSDVGTYSYMAQRPDGSNRPHAVSSVAGTWNAAFEYDANGNMTVSDGRTLVYSSYNLPTSITKGGQTTSLWYGAEHERVKQVDPDGTITLSLNPRLDSGAHYDQRTYPTGVVEKSSYIYAANRPIALSSINANGQAGINTLRYIHVDAQGSIVALSEGNITTSTTTIIVERLSYDAWGKRRNPDGTDDTSNGMQAVNTGHGYTGHWHLDESGLIHMNGRVYDPRLGRFTAADPVIQAPTDLQNFNRYSYVLNNPFMYTDPSGFEASSGGGVVNWIVNMFNSFVNWASGNSSGGGGVSSSNSGLPSGNAGNSNRNASASRVNTTGDVVRVTITNPAVVQNGSLANFLKAEGYSTDNLSQGRGDGTFTVARLTGQNAQANGAGRALAKPTEHILENARDLKNQSVLLNTKGNAECVELIKQTMGAPPTSTWQEGRKITSDLNLTTGTAIATFVDGKYPNNSTGQHAAIFLEKNATGIVVMEQYKGLSTIQTREIPWVPRDSRRSNDGSAYSTILWQ